MIYEPSEDSFLIQKELIKICKGKSVLDMGSGSGILAISAIKNGASSALAADIDNESFSHLKKQNIPSIKSNLFSNIKGKFDIIVFNPPYLPEDKREDKESQKATTGGRKGDEIILKFLKEAPDFLNENGTILLLTSSLTPESRIKSIIKKKRLIFKIISEKNLFMEKLFVWKIEKK